MCQTIYHGGTSRARSASLLPVMAFTSPTSTSRRDLNPKVEIPADPCPKPNPANPPNPEILSKNQSTFPSQVLPFTKFTPKIIVRPKSNPANPPNPEIPSKISHPPTLDFPRLTKISRAPAKILRPRPNTLSLHKNTFTIRVCPIAHRPSSIAHSSHPSHPEILSKNQRKYLQRPFSPSNGCRRKNLLQSNSTQKCLQFHRFHQIPLQD